MAWIFGDSGDNDLAGTSRSDLIVACGGNDMIVAGAGHDWVFAGSGEDTVYGGAGNDWIFGGRGEDVLHGDEGHDAIFGGKDADTLFGGSGHDWLVGGSGDDEIEGGEGCDWLQGCSGHDLLSGGEGKDVLFGGSGGDTLLGGDDKDWLFGGSGDDGLEGGEGNDKLKGGAGEDSLSGDEGDDYLDGGKDDDHLNGGDGFDRVDGGKGADIGVFEGPASAYTGDFGDGFDFYDGGAGDQDRLQLTLGLAQLSDTAIQADIAAYQAHIDPGGADQSDVPFDLTSLGLRAVNWEILSLQIVGLEFCDTSNVVFGSNVGETLTGTALAELILAFDGDDTVDAGDDDDCIVGGAGNDDLRGEGGDDSFIYLGTNNGFDSVAGGAGQDQIIAVQDGTRIGLASGYSSGVELITADGNNGVSVVGDNGVDVWDFSNTVLDGVVINGQGGDDDIRASDVSDSVLRGAGGNDTLRGGGAGTTTIYQVSGSGEGFDDHLGGAGTDIVTALSNNTRIGLVNSFGPGNSVEEITADGNTGVQVWGQNSGDTWDFSATTLTDVTVSSNGGNDSVIGSAGADMIRGGGGNDDLDGGAGDDMFLVSGSGEGFDDYQGGAGTDTIKALSANTRIGLGNGFGPGNSIEEITADGNSGVQVWGQNSPDTWDFSATTLTDVTVSSNGGNDSVIGSGGADMIRGGGGNDDLDGGAGDDMFLVSGSGEGFDEYQGGAGSDSIKALSANTRIGLGNGFDGSNNIETITADGNSGVQIWGQNSADTWDFTGMTLTGVTISSNGGNDSIIGTDGDDIIRGGGGDDHADGADGSDTYLVSGSGEVFDLYSDSGVSGTDVIKALSANTRIGLQSVFNAANGIEAITADGNAGVQIWGQNSPDTWDFSTTTLTGVTVSSNGGNDSVIGSGGADMIRGGGGNDDLDGGAGDDMFLVSGSGEGFDEYQGGAGSDSIKALSANTRIGLGNGFDGSNNIETITADGNSGVQIWGQNSADTWDFTGMTLTGVTISSNGGNDSIIGTDGDDIIRGGGGDDHADGADGSDTYLVSGSGEVFDLYSDSGVSGTDVIKALSANTRIGLQSVFNAANGIEAITADGNSGVQVWGQNSPDTWDFSTTTLTGVTVSSNGGNDSVIGSGGADMIRGGGGNDDLDGGAGDDMFLVSGSGEGFDDYQGGAGSDTIKALSNNTRIGLQNSFGPGNGIEEITADGNTGVQVWGQNSADTWDFTGMTLTDVTIAGNGGSDSVIGSDGDDVFRGGSGDDVLLGGLGSDRLTGDSGSDTFVLRKGDGDNAAGDPTLADVITDYVDGTDKIGLVIGDLVFGDLGFVLDGANTRIVVTGTSEILAVVEGNLPAVFDSSDFVPLP